MIWLIVYCFVCAIIGCIMLALENSQITAADIFALFVLGWLVLPCILLRRLVNKLEEIVLWKKKQ